MIVIVVVVVVRGNGVWSTINYSCHDTSLIRN